MGTDGGDTYSFREISAWLGEAGFVNPRTLEGPRSFAPDPGDEALTFSTTCQLGFLTTNREGRGFNPAVADASNCLPVSRPAPSVSRRTARGARRTEGWEPLRGGVKTPPFGCPAQSGEAW
jgi:hypothetical protein